MTELLTRRKLLTTGLLAAAGASGVSVAVYLAKHYGLIPPDHGGIYGVGETLTYAAQRVLTSRESLVREFSRSEISKAFPVIGPRQIMKSTSVIWLAASRIGDWLWTVS
jgi:hypothetical protein